MILVDIYIPSLDKTYDFQVDEEVSTLLEFDIINLDGRVQKELLESIRREGVLLYEKI